MSLPVVELEPDSDASVALATSVLVSFVESSEDMTLVRVVAQTVVCKLKGRWTETAELLTVLGLISHKGIIIITLLTIQNIAKNFTLTADIAARGGRYRYEKLKRRMITDMLRICSLPVA
jgi:hypothetical protein